jgi:hypothetical protein
MDSGVVAALITGFMAIILAAYAWIRYGRTNKAPGGADPTPQEEIRDLAAEHPGTVIDGRTVVSMSKVLTTLMDDMEQFRQDRADMSQRITALEWWGSTTTDPVPRTPPPWHNPPDWWSTQNPKKNGDR